MSIMSCIECKNSIEYCFCSCAYCGKMKENCCCNLVNTRNSDKTVPIKHHSKYNLLKQSKTFNLTNSKDDEWWRLEKWQIGRCKFP